MGDPLLSQSRKRKLPAFLQPRAQADEKPATPKAAAIKTKAHAAQAVNASTQGNSPVKQVQTKLKLQKKPRSASVDDPKQKQDSLAASEVELSARAVHTLHPTSLRYGANSFVLLLSQVFRTAKMP
jgi:hypothetical protein